MKTVIDAVKYYSGDKFICGKHEKHHTHIANAVGTDRFYSVYAGDIGGDSVICTIAKYNQCVEEMTNMNIKPVYTQTMVDAGVMPSVGMEVAVKYTEASPVNTGILLYISDVNFIVDHASGEVCYKKDSWMIKPLDTRTGEDKAFDTYFSAIKAGDAADTFKSNVRKAFNAGVTWSGK